VIGRGNSWHWDRGLTEAELLGPIPEMTSFCEDLAETRARAAAVVGKVSAKASEMHPAIQRLLNEDEIRRERQRGTPYPIADKPRFDTPLERRRLKILNSLAEADALRRARDIRTYVDEVRAENDRSPNPVPMEEVEVWATWALRQADLVDPVRSRAFLASQQ
jgi:hypothetical protein